MTTWLLKLSNVVRLFVIALLVCCSGIVGTSHVSASGDDTAPLGIQARQADDDDDDETDDEDVDDEDVDDDEPVDDDDEADDDEADDEDVDADLEDLGITSDTSYESPQLGTEVEWDSPYVLADDDTVGSVEFDEETGDITRDWLYLISDDEPFGNVYINIYSVDEFFYETPEDGVEDWMTWWAGDSLDDDLYSGDAIVILEDDDDEYGLVVVLDTYEDLVFMRLLEVHVIDDVLVTVDTIYYVEDADDVEDAVDYLGELQIDGDDAYQLIDVDDVLEAYDDNVGDLDTGSSTSDDDDDDDEVVEDDDEDVDDDEPVDDDDDEDDEEEEAA